MSKRSYQQFCPLAYTLDVIGERWTLLIVRELIYGPRRYSDLLRGLPGIGTNLLAKRLKELDEAGVIEQRVLPPPAASKVYDLTEYGAGLREVIIAMSKWGMGYLQLPISDDDSFGVVQAMTALRLMFYPPAAGTIQVCCEIHSDNEIFFAAINAETIAVGQGTAIQPDIIIQADLKTLPDIIAGITPLPDALSNKKIALLRGDVDVLAAFFGLFRVPFPVST
jgi:DNA-binding HxlR family transcriptional regulator